MEANLQGKDYLIGDLHGCYGELMSLLKFVRFNPECDRLFCVGDLIHRGHYSHECLKLLRSRNKQGKQWFFSALGNHDEFLAQKYFRSYKVDVSDYEKEMTALPYIYEVGHPVFGSFFILHSELSYEWIYPDELAEMTEDREEILNVQRYRMLLENHSADVLDFLRHRTQTISREDMRRLLWSREILQQHWLSMGDKSGKYPIHHFNNGKITQDLKIFCGHSVMPFVQRVGHQIYCDTGSCFGYDPESGKKIRAYHKWGMGFFHLSMIDINMGLVYACVSSEKGVYRHNGHEFSVKRGDILKMPNPIYPNVFEHVQNHL